jgi:uncharacterized protein YndB with AHSA1/START domain
MGTVATPEVKTGGDRRVEIRRVIRASRQRVYEAWTRPEELRKWLAPGPMRVVHAQADLRVGGAYRIQMEGSMDGHPELAERRVSAMGEYTELVANERVSFTWRVDFNTDPESRVTVQLRDVEGGTELVLIHEQIANDEARGGYTRGWTSCVDKLAAVLGG